ncbi:MAG TPA: histidine kinase dimerization/phospho-acceptor domain-containing protein [Candidatus Micrarchaeaceae archaeon]|nr:histidine kinase dimerization/phospho-acceptor domain-containing protein [Candidatus Micrarchaeaceae archaeon]
MGATREHVAQRPDHRDPVVLRSADAADDKAPQSSPSASGITAMERDVEARFRLGQALATRVSDVTHLTEAMAAKANLTELTSRRFTKPLRHIRNLSTRLYAEWLTNGSVMTPKQRDFISRLGVMAAVDGLSVGELTRSYLLFRDATLRVLDQEIARLGTPTAVVTEARSVVRATNDSAIVRMARAYDARMQSDKFRALAAGKALRDSETQLKAAVVDISDKNAQLIEASRLQSSFIANMSHELRTPLTGILGFTELLLADAGSLLGVEQRQAVLEIETSGHVLLTLVNDILDESKIEAGQMSLEVGCVDLKELVDAVVLAMRELADRKSLYLVASVPEAAQALGDPFRLQQVMTNLLGNAIKFTATGGVTVACIALGESWRVSVTDTGIGMSEQTRARLFQKFKQADSSMTRRFGGTGLGLAIAQMLPAGLDEAGTAGVGSGN